MKKVPAFAILLLASFSAAAHPGHVEHGFMSGVLHPLTGADHLLALLAAGIWSMRQRTPQLFGQPSPAAGWLLPAVFLGMMAAGAAAGMLGLRIPGLEGGIALTVVLTGVLIAAAVRMPVWAGALVMGVFAVFHGNAHGLELPQAASAAGFMLASAALLAAGRLLGTFAAARWAGGAIAAAGVALLAM